jgi:hypothetical protein
VLLRYEPFDKLRANGASWKVPVRAEPVEALVTVLLRYEPFDKLRANGLSW